MNPDIHTLHNGAKIFMKLCLSFHKIYTFTKYFSLKGQKLENLPYAVFIEFLKEQILDWISMLPLLNSFG